MKKVIIGMMLMFSILLFAKTYSPMPRDEAGRIVYTAVVQVDGVSANDLFDRAYAWVVKNSDRALQNQDRASGVVVGSGHCPLRFTQLVRQGAGQVGYTISVAVKDGRYKFDFAAFEHINEDKASPWGSGGSLDNEKPTCGSGTSRVLIGVGGKGIDKKTWLKIKTKTHEHVLEKIEDLKKAMAVPAAEW